MLKARRKEPSEQLKFPEPRDGLPEDPRVFMGSEHFVAAAALQQHLTARCLVAVVGRPGSGKSTVGLRAANSRWARQWFLQDEAGQPVHRRFWADLEDCRSTAETVGKIAHALGRPTFREALARLGSGKPCLLILDNTDQAFAGDPETLTQLAACVQRGASIIVTRRQVADLDIGRRWADVIEVPGFGSHDEARQLFDHLAPRHSSDLRADDIVAACDGLPLALSLLARAAAQGGLEQARLRVGAGGAPGLEFALGVAAATFAPEDRQIWAALSEFPAGLSEDDLAAVMSGVPNARQRLIRLHLAGVVQRGPSGVRIPAPLRLPASAAGLDNVAVAELWQNYVRRAQTVVQAGAVGNGAAPMAAAGTLPAAAPGAPAGAAPDSPAALAMAPPPPAHTEGADRWLALQVATLLRLATRHPLPEGTMGVAHAGLLGHRSGVVADAVDQVLVQLLEGSMDGADVAGVAQTAALLEDQRRFGASALLAGALVEAHRRGGDPAAESSVLCQLGRVERLSGRYDDAEAHLLQARARYAELGDGVGEGSALFELGQIALERGRLDDAESHLEAARSLFATHGRPVGEANADLDLVRVDLARGRLDLAGRRLDDALDRYEVANHRLGAANTLLQMGQLELARGQLDAAGRRLNAALDRYEQAADKVGFAHACLQLGQVDLARGNLANAERRCGAALAGYERVGDQVGRAHASLQLGQIDLARGRLDDAAARLASARAGYERLGDRLGMAHASLQLGQVHLARGEMEEAELKLAAAQATYDEIGDQLGSANSRQIESLFLQTQGRRAAAMSAFAEAARLYASLGRMAAAGWSLAGAARNCTGRAERHGYAADAVRLLKDAGMAAAAAQVTTEFTEPEPAPPPAAGQVPAESAWPAKAAGVVAIGTVAPPAEAPVVPAGNAEDGAEPAWPAKAAGAEGMEVASATCAPTAEGPAEPAWVAGTTTAWPAILSQTEPMEPEPVTESPPERALQVQPAEPVASAEPSPDAEEPEPVAGVPPFGRRPAPVLPAALRLRAEPEAEGVAVPGPESAPAVAPAVEATGERPAAVELGLEPEPQAAPDPVPAPECHGGSGPLLAGVELWHEPDPVVGEQQPFPEDTEPARDAGEPIDARDLIRVAHGDPVSARPGAAADQTLPPEVDEHDDAGRRSRFRFGRKKVRKKGSPDDSPMLPGFES